MTQQRFWIVVIESKNKRFSLVEALPQALAYMMTSPNEPPTFGLVTNGTHFAFLKVACHPSPCYATSSEWFLKRSENELYAVLRVLRQLGGVAQAWVNGRSA